MKNIFKSGLLLFALTLLVLSLPNLTHAKQNDTYISQVEKHINVPLAEPENEAGDLPTKAKAAANVGYVNVWVSKDTKNINWKVVVNPPYKGNGFSGRLQITNLSSGLSSGNYNITTMKGSMIAPPLKAKYSARLSGTLSYNGVPTGVTINSPYLVWTRK